MNTHRVLVGLLAVAAISAPVLMGVQRSKTKSEGSPGRYMVVMGGCNNCHTRGYLQGESKVPEADWLAGDVTGYYGPWGTSYPTSLRVLASNMTEDAWVTYLRELRTLPPMPWWVMHEMRESDLRAMYRFVKGLGPKEGSTPEDLPPGQQPKPPYVAYVFGATQQEKGAEASESQK
jgi:mono/diheme cytochrome c family protein